MQETLYQTADAGDYQTADAGDSIRQQMQETLYRQRLEETLHQTADAGDSIRQRMQETLYKTADTGDSPSDSG